MSGSARRKRRPTVITDFAGEMADIAARLSLLERRGAQEHKPSAQVEHKHTADTVESRLQSFASDIRKALHAWKMQNVEEVHLFGRAASADVKATAHTLKDMMERQARIEQRLLSIVQEQAKLRAAMGATATTGSAGLTPGEAAAAASADVASKALAAAQDAESAAKSSARALEAAVAQHKLEAAAARERERRLGARLDMLTATVAEQGQAANRACETEAIARQRSSESLVRRVADWEAAHAARLQQLESSARTASTELISMRLGLRMLSAAGGVNAPRQATNAGDGE